MYISIGSGWASVEERSSSQAMVTLQEYWYLQSGPSASCFTMQSIIFPITDHSLLLNMKTTTPILLLILTGYIALTNAGCFSNCFSPGNRRNPTETVDSHVTHVPQLTNDDFLSPRTDQLQFMAPYLQQAEQDFNEKWNNPQECIGSLDDFDLTAWIGKGSMSEVILGRNKQNGENEAIKIMHKKNIYTKGVVLDILEEKRVFQAVDFTFLIKMKSCFKDNSNLYFAMEYSGCGTVQCGFDENVVRFYAAQLVLALHYLHSMNLIYRDLKMENVLVGQDGYIKLADFGFTTKVDENGRATAKVGTPAYQAPELFSRAIQSYDKSVDFWALGALIYRLVSRTIPFGVARNDDLPTLRQKFVNGQLEFNDRFSANLQNLLRNLLQRDPQSRYGIENIVRHNWFESINWEDLFYIRMRAPVRPDRCNLECSREKINEAIGVIDSKELHADTFAYF